MTIWRRGITESELGLYSNEELKKIFDAGSSLLDTDAGTKQQAISILAEEPGLRFICQLIEKNIPRAVDGCSRTSLWNVAVLPLLKMLSHSGVTSSLLLERQLAAITAVVIGIRSKRLKILFDFAFQNLDVLGRGGSPRKFETAMESLLSLFSTLLESSTSNMVDDTFTRIGSRLTLLAIDAAYNLDTFTSMQSARYLKHIHHCLKVGQSFPVAGEGPGEDISRADFILERDLPGELSLHGRRHDNDHSFIGDIQILPTFGEIVSTRPEYLPSTNPNQSHATELHWVFDRNFRLLREDTVGKLRDSIRAELECLASGTNFAGLTPSNAISRRNRTYQNLRLNSISLDSRSGLQLKVSFLQLAKSCQTPQERQIWWTNSRRLQHDALVCVVSSSGSATFCTVVHQFPSREEDPQQINQETNLWRDRDLAFALLRPVEINRTSLEGLAAWCRQATDHLLVEFPGTILPTFQPTLEALQSMARKLLMPLDSCIVPRKLGEKAAKLEPPQYALKPGFRFNLKRVTTHGQDVFHSFESPADPFVLAQISKLDITQSTALLNSLNRSLSLTEGPPGTGKSFTGGALIRVLIGHKEMADLGPIICISYTNHALDQILEHLHQDGVTKIIRIGGKSQCEALAKVNLRAVAKNEDRTKQEKSTIYNAVKEMREAAESATLGLQILVTATSAQNIKTHLRAKNQLHHDFFFREQIDEEGFIAVSPSHLKR